MSTAFNQKIMAVFMISSFYSFLGQHKNYNTIIFQAFGLVGGLGVELPELRPWEASFRPRSISGSILSIDLCFLCFLFFLCFFLSLCFFSFFSFFFSLCGLCDDEVGTGSNLGSNLGSKFGFLLGGGWISGTLKLLKKKLMNNYYFMVRGKDSVLNLSQGTPDFENHIQTGSKLYIRLRL